MWCECAHSVRIGDDQATRPSSEEGSRCEGGRVFAGRGMGQGVPTVGVVEQSCIVQYSAVASTVVHAQCHEPAGLVVRFKISEGASRGCWIVVSPC